MNRLVDSLIGICTEHLLEEKWLIAPSLRTGNQWLDSVSRSGFPAVNVRVKTLDGLARDLVASGGGRVASALGETLLVGRIWSEFESEGEGYLRTLHPSWGLFAHIHITLASLRLASLSPDKIVVDRLEVARKGKEIRAFLETYARELSRRGWMDPADLFSRARKVVAANPEAAFEAKYVLVPDDLDCLELERRLLGSIPKDRLLTLPVDPPWQGASASEIEDISGVTQPLLFPDLGDPNDPIGCEFDAFRALGEVNEVREVLRRCLEEGRSLDEVEILHTDRETYVPTIYEVFRALLWESGDYESGIPVTFEEGLPACFSKPGRALVAWLEWIEEDFPQTRLVEMVRGGLFQTGSLEAGAFHDLATTLQTIRIGFGRDRYLRKIDERLASLEKARPVEEEDEEGNPNAADLNGLERKKRNLHLLRSVVQTLLEVSPQSVSDGEPQAALKKARDFLDRCAARADKVDNYAYEALVEEIDRMASALSEVETFHFEPTDWIGRLPNETRILGSRPRPGHLHVAHLLSGGHSGRSHTFAIGLDDSRFPGATLQDPILLDGERRSLSSAVPTSADRLDRKIRGFWCLLGRLRGEVTFSYSCKNVQEDREMFPSPLLVDILARLSQSPNADREDLIQSLPPPVSFAPNAGRAPVGESDLWLARLGWAGPTEDAEEWVRRAHPHLLRGAKAQAQRNGPLLSSYDGWIPSHLLSKARSIPVDPFSADGPILSARRLEEAGRCPLAYFFHFVLGIEAPEDRGVEPDRWLSATETGSLLHEVFREFLAHRIGRDELPVFDRDEGEVYEILDRSIREYRDAIPPPSESIFRREYDNLKEMARVFLLEEEENCRSSRPVLLEVGFGLESDPASQSPDRLDAVRVALAEGASIRTRGRIDRIDRLPKGDDFLIWDYKTGSASDKYRKNPPFNQGRNLQHFLYLNAAMEILPRVCGPGSRAVRFGYFFLGERGRGDRLTYTPGELEAGSRILFDLCSLLREGCFVPTQDRNDCTYCEFAGICGDVEALTAAGRSKMENDASAVLAPFRRLRGCDVE